MLEIAVNCIYCIINEKQSVLSETLKISEKQTMSDSEQEILMYISGYILHSLKKMAKRFKTTYHQEVSVLIHHLVSSQNTQTFVSKFKKWTEKLNRGGLILPCDDFFLLVRNMEIVMKIHLSESPFSTDVISRTVCIEKILNNVNIQYLWD